MADKYCGWCLQGVAETLEDEAIDNGEPTAVLVVAPKDCDGTHHELRYETEDEMPSAFASPRNEQEELDRELRQLPR